MKFILHIGQSKTGTSSLQSFLAENRDELRRQGVLYPDIYYKGMPLKVIEHNSVAASLLNYKKYPGLPAEEYFRQFREQASNYNCDKILLSGESFFGGAPHPWDMDNPKEFPEFYKRKLERLKSLIEPDDCEIYVYLRRQDQWLESAIAHQIRYDGLGKSRNIYRSDEQMYILLKERMDYTKLLKTWEEILAPSDIHVVPYEKNILTGNNTITDFLARLGLHDKFSPQVEKQNVQHKSWCKEIVEFKKNLNKKTRTKSEERTIISILNRINDEIGSHQKYKISSDLRDKVLIEAERQNRQIAESYNNNSEDFFTSRVVEKGQKTEPPDPEKIKEIVALYHKRKASLRTKVVFARHAVARFLRNKARWLHTPLRHLKLLMQR